MGPVLALVERLELSFHLRRGSLWATYTCLRHIAVERKVSTAQIRSFLPPKILEPSTQMTATGLSRLILNSQLTQRLIRNGMGFYASRTVPLVWGRYQGK